MIAPRTRDGNVVYRGRFGEDGVLACVNRGEFLTLVCWRSTGDYGRSCPGWGARAESASRLNYDVQGLDVKG